VVLLRRVLVSIGLICAAALAAGGCSSNSAVFDADAYSGAFSKPFKAFDAPEWATSRNDNIHLGPSGPVAPEDLVAADGRCAPEAVPVAAAPPAAPVAATVAPEPAPAPADRPVGTIAGDLAGAPMPVGAAPPARPAPPPDRLEPEAAAAAPVFGGGVALGMTECQVVRRAGAPNSINIGADEKGERKVMMSYLAGSWPGIYQFQSGRLKEVEAAPEPAKPAKPVRKKPVKKKPAQAANHDVNRAFVQ